ncbi:MAG TPA: hypothetical protein PKO28_03800 [Bacilli bacterium]|nr:hypothetical protein [Bacilli bacterium]HPS18660.1 hypothetical protein [Bacilli bacterium]
MKNNKLPILGFLLLSLALVSSISLTAAWFIGASYLQIAQIDIKTKSPELTISTDNIEFKESLSKEDLMRVEDFKPVSSIFYQDWCNSLSTEPVFYNEYKTVDSEFMTSPNNLEAASYGYFSQEIYLKSNRNVYVSMVKDSDLAEGENPLFYPDADANATRAQRLLNTFGYEGMSLQDITAGLNNVVRSLRISILVLNNDSENIDSEFYRLNIIDPFYEEPTYYGGVLDNDLNKTFDNLNGQEVIYGWVHNQENILFDDPSTTTTGYEGQLTCFNSGHAAGVRPYSETRSLNNGFSIEREPALHFDDPSFDDPESDSGFIIPLKADISRKIVLSIYLEGWDKDSTNITMFGKFFVNLQFKILRSWVY